MKKRWQKKIIACVTALAMTVTVFPQSQLFLRGEKVEAATSEPDITTDLIGYYSFDDTLVNNVSTTNGVAKLHGGSGDPWNEPVKGTAEYAEGIKGKAYVFTGDTGEIVNTNTGIGTVRGEGLELDVKTSKSFTISAWVNTSEKVDYQPIVFTNKDGDNYITAGTNYNNFASGGIANYKTTWYWLDKNNNSESKLKDLEIGEWTHVTITFSDDGTVVMYYNAEILSKQTIPEYESEHFANMPIFLGINWWNRSFKGMIDEVYVYNRALSSEDVKELYDKSIMEDEDSDPNMGTTTVNKLYSKYFGTDKIYNRVTVHDPSIVIGYEDQETKKVYADEGAGRRKKYFIFGSHMAWAHSYDMKNWTMFRNNINDDYAKLFEKEAKWSALGNKNYDLSGNLWAPDVIWNPSMNKWCMYMSVNGDNYYTSIVLLTSDDLMGPWTYEGPVVYSGFTYATDANAKSMTDLFDIIGSVEGTSTIPARYKETRNGRTALYGMNAIDPCVFYDDDGKLWMSYGSWFGGIYMLELDPATGYRNKSHTYTTKTDLTEDIYQGIKIAGGNGYTGEASYIEKIGDRYYLFMSYGGFVATGGYNMRVFSSENVTGPYKDLSGNDARYYKNGNTEIGNNINVTGTVGSRLMSYYKWSFIKDGFVAQGHNSAVVDTDGKAFNIYHTRRDDGTEGHSVRVHQTFVAKNHGLVTAPFEYSGETLASAAYDKAKVAGEYQILYMDPKKSNNSLACVEEEVLTLGTDGNVSGTLNNKAVTGTWEQTNDGPYLTIQAGGVTYQGVFLEQNIEETAYETMCFTVVGNNDIAIWGYQNPLGNANVAYNAKNTNAQIPDKAFVGTKLDFNTKGYFGATYKWESLDTSLISADGVVQPVDQDTDAQVRLTITKGEYSHSKILTIKIICEESKSQLLPIESDAVLAEYDTKEQFNNATPDSKISQNTGLSLSFFTKGVTSDWTSMLVAQGELELGLSTLTRRSSDSWCNFNESQTERSEYSEQLYPNGENIHKAFYDNNYYVTISVNTDGSISYYRDGNLILTYKSNVQKADGNLNSTIGEVASKIIECYKKETLKFVYDNISNVVVGYGADFEPSSEDITEGYEYYADYDNRGSASDWKKGSGAGILSLEYDNTYGNYVQMVPSTDSGNRGAELNFYTANSESNLIDYVVELDTSLTGGVQDERSATQFAITGTNASYVSNNVNNGIASNYILKLASPTYLASKPETRTTYYINDSTTDSITIDTGTWVHIKAHVVGKTVGLTITNNATGKEIYNGIVKANGEGKLNGLYILSGRNSGVIKVDNIKAYENNDRQPGIKGDVEKLTGTVWWEENQVGKDYKLTGNGSIVLYVRADDLDANNYGAFNVELKGDPNYILTTGSDKNAWTVEGSQDIGTITGIPAETGSILEKGHTYRITVTRSGKDITVEYYDMARNKEYWTTQWLNSNMPDTFGVHIIAQVGTYSIWQKETLTGTAWWTGSQVGKDYELIGDGSLVLNVKADALNESNYGAFNVELKGEKDGTNYFLTTGSDKNAWTAEGSEGIGKITGIPDIKESTLQKDHNYKIIITRIGQDFVIEYYDMTTDQSYWSAKWQDSNMPDIVNTHIMAQIGTYTVQRIHTYKSAVTTEATCTEDGVRTYTCQYCDDHYNEVIEAMGHTEVIDQAVEATCTTDGKTEGSHCSICEEVLVEQEVIPALGHDYSKSTYSNNTITISCSKCDSTRKVILETQEGTIGNSYDPKGSAENSILLPTATTITRTGYTLKGWSDTASGSVKYQGEVEYETLLSTEDTITIYAIWEKIGGPTGTITIAEGKWDSFLTTITFGIYKSKQEEITIDAQAENGIKAVSYLIARDGNSYTEEQLATMDWTAYDSTAKPKLEKNTKNVVYAKLEDQAGNIRYLSSNGIIEDEIAPQITGFDVNVGGLTDHSAELYAEANEDGTYYFVLYKDSEDSLQSKKDSELAEAIIANATKSGAIPAGDRVILSETKLEKATNYNAYIAVRDAAGNASSRVCLFTTAQGMLELTNPTITGSVIYNSDLVADASNTENLKNYSYQWYRSSKPITEDTDFSSLEVIGKAVKGEYTIQRGDVGKYLAVTIALEHEVYAGSCKTYLTEPVKPKMVTATATIKDKEYNGTTDAEISELILDGVIPRDQDQVTAIAGDAIFVDSKVGNEKEVTVSNVALQGTYASCYQLEQTTIKTTGNIVRAGNAPNMPNAAQVWNVSNEITTVGAITLPKDWIWHTDDAEKQLIEGVEITAVAVYNGEDKGNYKVESVEIKIQRSTCAHKETEIRNEKAATCTETGYTGDTYCLSCNQLVLAGNETSALGHSFTDYKENGDATCTEDGTKTATCERCGETKTIVSEGTKKGHTIVIDPAIEPSCTAIGKTEGKHCSACGEVLEAQKGIAALGHDYESKVTKEPTVTETGIRTYTCKRCDHSYTEEIAKLPEETHKHEYTETITKEPTCTVEGVTTFVCSCGDQYTEAIKALGHNYEVVIIKPATVTESGIQRKTCKRCEDTYTEEIPKLEEEHKHQYTETITKEPTCTEKGIKTYVCTCGEQYTEDLEALGHDYKSEITKPATETETGIETFTCTRCDDSYTKEIPKLEEEHKHQYTETITKEPTCTEKGVKTFTCSCGDQYTEDLKALGHDYKSEITKPATITETGIETFTCSRCKDEYTKEIPKLEGPQPPNGNTGNTGSSGGTSSPTGSTSNNTQTNNNTNNTDNTNTTPQEPSENTPNDDKTEDKKVTTETKPDGTKVETVTETKSDGTTIETVTETKTDGSTISTKEIKTEDESASLVTVVETASDGKVTINSVIRTGVSDTSDTVTIAEELLKDVASDERLDSIVVEITDTTVNSATKESKKTVVNVNIPSVEGVAVEKVVLTKDSIEAAKNIGKGLVVNIINGCAKEGTINNYKVTIPAKQLAKIDSAIQEINVEIVAEPVTNVSDASKKNAITKIVNKNKGKGKKTCVVSLATNKEVKAGMNVTIPVTEKTSIAKGSKVYVYRYNAKTGKLIETANCKKTVSGNGTITIAATSGKDYVISAKKLSGNKVETIKEAISVSVSKKTAKAGKELRMKVSFPNTVSTKSKFGAEKATITYKSSDSKIASISKAGVITTKRSGTVTIKTTIKLASGQKIVKEQKITIK